MDHQSVKEVSQKLVATFFIVGMILASEHGTQFTLGNSKIDQFEYFDDVVIPETESNS
jgi:hypothetical protein